MSRRESLTEALEKLEREDPAVAAASRSYDETVERILSRTQCLSASLTGGRRRCQREHGHPGPHRHEDTNGVTAWGLAIGED